MGQPKKKLSLARALEIVDQLSREELLELRHQVDLKLPDLTWWNVDLDSPSQRVAFFEQEEVRAGCRVRQAFQRLQRQGIVDEKGKLLKRGLPQDMQPGSQCDVGG